MTAERGQEIAKTILAQLGGNRFRVMTGVSLAFAEASGLRFFLPSARAAKGVKQIRITLTPADVYTVGFYDTKGKLICEAENIYADDLRGLFESMTGLRTSL